MKEAGDDYIGNDVGDDAAVETKKKTDEKNEEVR